MSNVQTTAIVRDRGQLTIPELIRATQPWITPTSVVTIYSEAEDKIIIRPHHLKRVLNWDNIWHHITLSRSFIGKRGNLSGFIAQDRQEH